MTITTMQGCKGYNGKILWLVPYTPLSTEGKKWRVTVMSYSPCTPLHPCTGPVWGHTWATKYPASAPSTPIGPTRARASRNHGRYLIGSPRHRMNDPVVESDRPGTSPLGRCQRPRKAPVASAQPGASHSGVTAQREAQRQHSHRTIVTRPIPDHVIGHRPGEGVREKLRTFTVPPPLLAHVGQQFPPIGLSVVSEPKP
jgi:hypothetical protein